MGTRWYQENAWRYCERKTEPDVVVGGGRDSRFWKGPYAETRNRNGPVTRFLSIGDDEHAPVRKQRLALFVDAIRLLESFQAKFFEEPALFVVGQAIQIGTHGRAAHPVEHGARAVHDLQIL